MAVITYKCPNCGAEIKFEPKLQKGKCDFCLSEFTVDEIERLNGLDSQHINKENNCFIAYIRLESLSLV